MKTKIRTTILVLALASTSHAQSINVTPTGVGIGNGVGGPQGNFEIYTYTDGNARPLISLRSRYDGQGKYGMIRFGDASQTSNYQKGAIIYESTTSVGRGRMHLALENTDGAGSVALSDARLTVLSNGNVGVGTVNPLAPLDVANSFYSALGEIIIRPQIPTNSPEGGQITLLGSSSYSNVVMDNYAGSLRLFAGASSLAMNRATGNVAIGTSSFDEKFNVNGNVKAKGYVTAPSSWADYVFKGDYKLPTLTEVEEHIAANGHLPGIPSEKEVLAKGFNLAEMDSKLLAQIEQLTLHMIALNKKMEAQQEEIKALRAASGGTRLSVNSSK